MSDAMSGTASETADRTWTSDNPVAAFLLADAALATAASRYVSDRAGVSDPYAYVFNTAPSLSGPPSQSPVQDDHPAPGLLGRLNPISAAHAQSLTPAKVDLLSDELRGGHTLEKHVGKPGPGLTVV